jgi:CheY-like chemotaxis protein
MKHVLWLDNDLGCIRAYKAALEQVGYSVTVVKKVAEAEDLLRAQRFDIFILDVMIPTLNEAEEAVYPPSETDNGHKTGLLFYRRVKDLLAAAKTPVLVFSVRIDKSIQTAFLEEGLPADSFVPKMDLRLTPDFVRKIEQMVET